jgi:hypothetical protein
MNMQMHVPYEYDTNEYSKPELKKAQAELQANLKTFEDGNLGTNNWKKSKEAEKFYTERLAYIDKVETLCAKYMNLDKDDTNNYYDSDFVQKYEKKFKEEQKEAVKKNSYPETLNNANLLIAKISKVQKKFKERKQFIHDFNEVFSSKDFTIFYQDFAEDVRKKKTDNIGKINDVKKRHGYQTTAKFPFQKEYDEVMKKFDDQLRKLKIYQYLMYLLLFIMMGCVIFGIYKCFSHNTSEDFVNDDETYDKYDESYDEENPTSLSNRSQNSSSYEPLLLSEEFEVHSCHSKTPETYDQHTLFSSLLSKDETKTETVLNFKESKVKLRKKKKSAQDQDQIKTKESEETLIWSKEAS